MLQCLASQTVPDHFQGTTKNTHLFLMSLNLIVTVHIPNCVMIVLLYILNFICPFIVFLSSSSVTFLNSFLNVYHSIILPLLPVSILYGITILLIITDFCSNEPNQYSLFSILPLLSWEISTSISFTTLFLLLWHTFLKCPVLPQPHMFSHMPDTTSVGALHHNIGMAVTVMSE